MSATNLTKNLKLPQFVASDKPSWLGDVNGAMKNIDDGIGVIKGDITKASDTASSAKSQSDANTVTLGNVNTELTNIGNRVTALEAGGGTEQLEQRLQTVESDVTALQTRADTFEEEIAENGKKITKNASDIATLTPRVKSCEDNITSLQTTTDGLNDTVEQHSNRLTTTESTASNALNKANEALSTANIASANASSALTKIGNLEITAVGFSGYSLLNYSGAFSKVSPVYGIFNSTNLNLLPIDVKLSRQFASGDDVVAGNINIDNIASSINTSTIGESFAIESSERGIMSYFTASGTTLSLHIKANQQVGGVNVSVTLYLPTVIFASR